MRSRRDSPHRTVLVLSPLVKVKWNMVQSEASERGHLTILCRDGKWFGESEGDGGVSVILCGRELN
ncbi:hypothetical protein JG687_00008099 [Phytophthora cactorum]|uniref:Uncharacterized protein n=1 Tax=Phytophthora cactorum TaxID=29920 RepID=A0A8T1UF93_9STRA|nr:hypothetical protein JG687_00008099 [Phytophthora cactorum]